MPIPSPDVRMGATSGGISAISRNPSDIIVIPAPRFATLGIGDIEDGLPDVRMTWTGALDNTFLAQLTNHYAVASTIKWRYWLRYWDDVAQAYVTARGIMQKPEHNGMMGQAYFNVVVVFKKIGIP